MTQHPPMMKLLEPATAVAARGIQRKQTERTSVEQIALPGAECSEEFVTEAEGRNKKCCCDGADKDLVLPHTVCGPGIGIDPASKIKPAGKWFCQKKETFNKGSIS